MLLPRSQNLGSTPDDQSRVCEFGYLSFRTSLSSSFVRRPVLKVGTAVGMPSNAAKTANASGRVAQPVVI